MTLTRLPEPTTRRPTLGDIDVRALRQALEARVDGEVRFDPGSRGAYSTDASNYRQTPIGVVCPRTPEAGAEAVRICHEHRAPVVSRGGGTSLAGQGCNVAIVIDWSKYCHHLESIDADARIAVVQPGIVLDDLRAQANRHGLTFGPDPATHNHCTLGGMIGNNSCGVHALMAGKTVDNVAWLDVITHDGVQMRVGPTPDDELERIIAAGGRRGEIYAGMKTIRDSRAEQIRQRYPDIPRRVSGYNLDALLPEQGFDVAKALVGTESTCVTVLRAGLKLVPEPGARVLTVLGYPDVYAAADDVPSVLEHDPIGLEGLDHLLFAYTKEKNLYPEALAMVPDGHAWLLVEFGADDRAQARSQAEALCDRLSGRDDPPSYKIFDDPVQEQKVWAVREAGLAATTREPQGEDTWPGWEDSAVAVERLGDYLRDLKGLYDTYGYQASVYGHFGQACVHTRIDFDLRTAGGIKTFRAFLDDAADLCVKYGGSFSGEHGDGQARGALLPKMFGDELVQAMAQFKGLWDPDNLMNPGKIVAPYSPTENLRLGPDYRPMTTETGFAYPHDDYDFARAALRCVGVGRCRREEPSGGVMCPSYQVTREEEHSTRGRARLLFEMLNGDKADAAITDGWRSRAVRDSLDLCLACKGCKSDCPVQVDMATYKAEFLHQHYRRRLRPLAHYSMGWLPALAPVAARVPGLVNVMAQAPGLSRVAKLAGGIDQAREIPVFPDEPFTTWFRREARTREEDGLLVRRARGGAAAGQAAAGRRVLLWPDTFSNYLHPAVARAAVEVLDAAGWETVLPSARVCCGLTWISTGQLTVAKKVLRRTLNVLRPHLDAGGLVVGLEPSCTAVFRSDLAELLPHDEVADRLRAQTVTLAELLRTHTPDWSPPRLSGTAISQTHCHQHAVMGFDHDVALLQQMGLDQSTLDSGCCGVAGNFGFEKGHYEVSTACGEQALLPAVRAAAPSTIITADGFSCRTQIEQESPRRGLHLAQVISLALRGGASGPTPEAAYDDPRRVARVARRRGAVIEAAAGAGLLALALSRWQRRRS